MAANLKELSREISGILLGMYISNNGMVNVNDNLETIGLMRNGKRNEPSQALLDDIIDIITVYEVLENNEEPPPFTEEMKATLRNRLVELQGIVNRTSVTGNVEKQTKQSILNKLGRIIEDINNIPAAAEGGKRKYKKSRKSRKTLKKRKTHKKYKARK
jgi:hypothetical protein